MNSEPISSFDGTPLSEWIESFQNELEIDAVGLHQIIPGLRKGFGLNGAELERRTRQVVALLLARGARPITGANPQRKVTRYGENPSDIVDGVIADWHKMERDPHVGDIWFALPDSEWERP